jgi:transcriptional regulator with PAS, ATPase and Fis domain
MHKNFFRHDKHLLLSAEKDEDIRLETLLNQLKRDFNDHTTEGVYMDIRDVIDLTEIKPKVEAKLQQYTDDEIDIYFSPGTSIMQVAWYICHTTLGLKTRLIQSRAPKFTGTGKPEFSEITVEKSTVPTTAILKEQNLQKKTGQPFGIKDYLITNSLKPIYQRAEKIAHTDKVTSIIYGESGTGKEHLAQFIHDQSIRKNAPFLTVNCSAFGDQLLESRLFGYKKGAFTGADKDTKGILEEAKGGSVFLDEIGDISSYMQQALLRVIQNNEITPIGGKPQKIDVRFITATNRNLEDLCQEGLFRWDLYFRLHVAEIELPPLRQRDQHETRDLIDFFLKRKKQELRKSQKLTLTKEAQNALLHYPWPGNVRELENVMESLYVFCEDQVTQQDIPDRIRRVPEESSLHWKDVEKHHIKKVLEQFGGNQKQTKEAIGYGSINTLKSKMEEYGIDPETYKK